MFDPADRRYRYPFTNCTNCGPRFTIIEDLPYDRPNTTMAVFPMCPDCRREYDDPRDRRFHAQPNACPVCGPHLLPGRCRREAASGARRRSGTGRRRRAGGRHLALKGLGGFHLVVDARNQEAVVRLRERKARDEKPLALMAADLDGGAGPGGGHTGGGRTARRAGGAHRAAAPARPDARIAEAVAPGNHFLGVMLPYTPLHHLLLRRLAIPGGGHQRQSERRADLHRRDARRLSGSSDIADVFLVHDRPIARHVDDSVAADRGRADPGRVPRRARGLRARCRGRSASDGPCLLGRGVAVDARLTNT